MDLSYYYENDCIYDSLIPCLYQTDNDIRNKCKVGGSTIALAVKCMDNTYTLNIGDSRIYLNKNFRLKQISVDHNIAWDMYERGEIDNKDNIRFHKKSNLLTARLGCEKRLFEISKAVVNNNNYDKIYVCSDGITDCLSDQELEILSNGNTKKILISALSNDSINYNLNEDYYHIIDSGKDNSSVAVLRK